MLFYEIVVLKTCLRPEKAALTRLAGTFSANAPFSKSGPLVCPSYYSPFARNLVQTRQFATNSSLPPNASVRADTRIPPQIRRLLVVSKQTRFMYEVKRHQQLDLHQVQRLLESKDPYSKKLKARHAFHTLYVETLVRYIQKTGLHVDVISADALGALEPTSHTSSSQDQNTSASPVSPTVSSPEKPMGFDLSSYDVFISAGGDGTFLTTAACLSPQDGRLLLGINTDKTRSQGHMCVRVPNEKLFSYQYNRELMGKIMQELVDNKLLSDYILCLEDEAKAYMSFVKREVSYLVDSLVENRYDLLHRSRMSVKIARQEATTLVLSQVALNEIFFCERNPVHTFYYELLARQAVQGPEGASIASEHQYKSSGLLVATGTGTTAWYKSMLSLSPDHLEQVSRLLLPPDGPAHAIDFEILSKKLNKSFEQDPSSPYVYFCNRELIRNRVFRETRSFGAAFELEIKPHSFDGIMFLDGREPYSINNNDVITLMCKPEDSLACVIFG